MRDNNADKPGKIFVSRSKNTNDDRLFCSDSMGEAILHNPIMGNWASTEQQDETLTEEKMQRLRDMVSYWASNSNRISNKLQIALKKLSTTEMMLKAAQQELANLKKEASE